MRSKRHQKSIRKAPKSIKRPQIYAPLRAKQAIYSIYVYIYMYIYVYVYE